MKKGKKIVDFCIQINLHIITLQIIQCPFFINISIDKLKMKPLEKTK